MRGGSALCVCANDTVIRAKQTTIDNKNNLSISIKDTRFARLFVELNLAARGEESFAVLQTLICHIATGPGLIESGPGQHQAHAVRLCCISNMPVSASVGGWKWSRCSSASARPSSPSPISVRPASRVLRAARNAASFFMVAWRTASSCLGVRVMGDSNEGAKGVAASLASVATSTFR